MTWKFITNQLYLSKGRDKNQFNKLYLKGDFKTVFLCIHIA